MIQCQKHFKPGPYSQIQEFSTIVLCLLTLLDHFQKSLTKQSTLLEGAMLPAMKNCRATSHWNLSKVNSKQSFPEATNKMICTWTYKHLKRAFQINAWLRYTAQDCFKKWLQIISQSIWLQPCLSMYSTCIYHLEITLHNTPPSNMNSRPP